MALQRVNDGVVMRDQPLPRPDRGLSEATRTAIFDYAAQPKEMVNCPVCGTENSSTLTQDRYGYDVWWSVCACGLEYLNPRMTAEAYRAFYQGPYRALVTAWSGTPYPLEIMERSQKIWGAALGYRLKHWGVPRGVTLLDVGGSTGAVAQGIGQVLSVSRVTVLDPSGPELERAKARGYQTVEANAEDCPVVDPHDVIVCTQTLDHLREPLPVLKWLRTCGARMWVDIVPAQVKIDHPVRWNPASLKRALAQSGWTIRKCATEKLSKHSGVWCVIDALHAHGYAAGIS